MIRCRFRQPVEDPRPANWPIKHPYWITGEGEGFYTIVAYADDEVEILANWPEARMDWAEPREDYVFNSRFPKPDWFDTEPGR